MDRVRRWWHSLSGGFDSLTLSSPDRSPRKPTGETRPGDLRYNIMVRLGNLGCPHDVDHLDTEALRAHWRHHLEFR